MGGDTNLEVAEFGAAAEQAWVETRRARVARLIPHQFKASGLSLEDRLWAKVRKGEPWECWPWEGGSSAGGQRGVRYGLINEGNQDGGSRKRTWRVHILAKLLGDPEVRVLVPRDEGEDLIPWLRRARRWFVELQDFEAAHQCDSSLCCNPRHLEWETHRENLEFQRARDERRKIEPGWVPVCCEKPGRERGVQIEESK